MLITSVATSCLMNHSKCVRLRKPGRGAAQAQSKRLGKADF